MRHFLSLNVVQSGAMEKGSKALYVARDALCLTSDFCST